MSSDHRNEPVEFFGEMPNEYEDEEYYGEEEDYADEGDHEEYEEEAAASAPAKPKGSIVRTAIFGVAGMLLIGGIGYYAATIFMPDTVQSVVNSIPGMAHDDASASADPNAPPKTAKGTEGGDVAAVPPDPAAASKMKDPAGSGAAEAGKPAGEEGTESVAKPPQKPVKNPSMAKPAAKPPKLATAPNAAPMEGVPMEGVPMSKPAAKPAAKAPAAKPMAAAKPMMAKKASPVSASKMAAARADWLKRHPRKGAPQMAAAPKYGRGAYLGYGSRVVWSHGHAKRVWAPVYAAVPRVPAGRYPLATARTLSALPASWKHTPRGAYAVQIGSFASTSNASQLVSQLRAQGITAYTAAGGGKARVFIGSFGSRQAAAVKMQQLQAQGIPAAVTNP